MLNDSQIKNLWLGITVLVMIGIYPPWKEFGKIETPLGFAPIMDPPKVSQADIERGVNRIDIDFSRLGVELFLGIAVTFGLVMRGASATAPTAPASNKSNVTPIQQASSNKNVPPKAPTLPPNSVVLPAGTSLGSILVESDDDPEYWEELMEARGTFQLPKNKRLQLEIDKENRVDLSLLNKFPTGSIFSIDASDSKTTDEDAMKLASVNGLKELDLSGTPVTSSAINSLRSLKTLEKLWLDNTNIDDNCVPALISLTNLKKLSMENTRLNELSIESLRKDLPESTELKI